jgi:uncharacterized phage-associated protein
MSVKSLIAKYIKSCFEYILSRKNKYICANNRYLNNKQMYSSLEIADYFLYAHQDKGITPMKLTKLVYIAHGWHLAITGSALINESPEAWQYGPVIPSVYNEFKGFKNTNISRAFEQNNMVTKEEDITFLERIWKVYGVFDAIQLSSKTHQPDSPWSKIWNENIGHQRNSLVIPDIDIKNYYQWLLAKSKQKIQATT